MKVVKRDGVLKPFDQEKIKNAIAKANAQFQEMSSEDIDLTTDDVLAECGKMHENRENISVEDIQDLVENSLMNHNFNKTAKAYILYREQRSNRRKAKMRMMKDISDMVSGKSEYWNNENSNKNAQVVTTQRDYIAGITSIEIAKSILLPSSIVEAHEKGIIHIHDLDYYAQNALTNCCLINLDDMLQNGTKINGIMIERPHWLSKAMTISTQIITAVASSQYGGASINLSDLAPFVRESRKKYLDRYENRGFDRFDCEKYADEDLRQEIESAVQTFNYQINSMSTTNGQAPFITVFMYLNERPEYKKEHAMLIEEFLKQRLLGMKNERGVYVTPAFPKLIYVLEEDNIKESGDYYYLTQMAARCSAKRMVPDYISEKVMKSLKHSCYGTDDCYAVMGALAGHEHLIVKVNDGAPMDLTIKQLYEMCKSNNTISGRPTQIYYSKEELNLPYLGRGSKDRNRKYSAEFKPGVYKITYLPEDISYIGSSSRIQQRWNEHIVCIRTTGGPDCGIKFKDPCLDNYKFEVLEYTENYKKAEEKYILSEPNINIRGNSKRYYKVSVNNRTPKYERPIFKQNLHVRQDLIDLNDINIKVLDRDNKWTHIKHIFKNDKLNTPYMMEIVYLDRNKKYSLSCTEDHPLWNGERFLRADNFKLGDTIYRGDNTPLTIIKISYYNVPLDSYDIGTETGTFIGSDIIMHNCRSALTPDRFSKDLGNVANAFNYIEGKPKYSGRFNQGVVTINLPDVAFSSKGDVKEFWHLFDERLELCHKALRCRHERLMGKPSDMAPILWQDGAFARLGKGEKIDRLLYNGYSTISLGYGGLYECVKYMTGHSHTEPEGEAFGLQVMRYMNDKCDKWKKSENIDYSLYGTPMESTTYKFAKCLKKRFGDDVFVKLDGKDRNYITNSYHVPVFEEIDAFSKLLLESRFQILSPGGAISYIETADLNGNIEAVMEVIKFIYDNIMYAELNTKSDYCQVCGYAGEAKIDENMHWYCPNCGNYDQNKMNIARRTCGYIGTKYWNYGRTQEIKDRVVHLGGDGDLNK